VSTQEQEVTYSGDTRVVKHLLFPYFEETESDSMPGVNVFAERVAKRGQVISVDEIREADLKKGERLGSFFNDEELAEMERIADSGGNPMEVNTTFDASEMGEHEIAEHIEENKLSVQDTVALAGSDPDTAQRVLEAESIAQGGDSRKGVVAGLEAIIERGNQ